MRACTYLLTYLLTYTVGSGRIKPAISPKRLNITKVTIITACIKTYTGFRLLSKCILTLNNLWARFQVIDSLNTAKNDEIQLSNSLTPTPCRVAGCIISIRPTYSCARALTYLLTYLFAQLARTYKTGNISETVEDWAKVTIYDIKSYMGFRLPPNCMTLNDLWARFKVIDSLNAATWRNTD